MRRGRPDGVHSRCVALGVVVATAAVGVRMRRASTMVYPPPTHDAESGQLGGGSSGTWPLPALRTALAAALQRGRARLALPCCAPSK